MTPTHRPNRPQLERLEQRDVPSTVATSFANGVLRVTGTDASDTIILRQTGEGRVTAYLNTTTRTFTGVRDAYVDARSGNDYVWLDTSPLGTNEVRLAIRGTLIGGTGNDTLIGGANIDTIYGNAGSDGLYGNAGNDNIYGGDGDDVINGGLGNDMIMGEAGNDRMYGSTGNDTVNGGAGQDYVDGGVGYDNLQGGTGFDTFKNVFPDFDTVDQADPEDVRQGLSGTCVILSSLQAISNAGVDLSGRIQQISEKYYRVPIYRPGTGWVNQVVFFDGSWTDNDAAPTQDGNPWVLLYQRAFLQEKRVNWQDPNSANWATKYGGAFQQVDAAFMAVMGRAQYVGSRTGGLLDSDLSMLRNAFAANRPTIILSRPSNSTVAADMTRLGIITSHAYSLVGFGSRNGQTTVKMRNPWGTDGPVRYGIDDGIIEINWSDFRRVMLGFTMA